MISTFDLIFFVDGNSLIEGNISILENVDFEKSKIRLFKPEVDVVNAHYKKISDTEQKDIFKKTKIGYLNQLIEEKRITFLNDESGKTDYRLLEILLKKFYNQNILIITNNKSQAQIYLPLIPIYRAFGQNFTVASLKESLIPYEYLHYSDAMMKLQVFNTDATTLTVRDFEKEASSTIVINENNDDLIQEYGVGESSVDDSVLTDDLNGDKKETADDTTPNLSNEHSDFDF